MPLHSLIPGMPLRHPHARILRYFVIALGLLFTTTACMPTADGVKVSKKAKRQAKGAKSGRNPNAAMARRAMAGLATGNAGRIDSSAASVPIQRKAGWVVKGTDLMLFHPCGDPKGYFVMANGQVMARIAQRYKFSVPRPYAPLYVDLKVRLVNDTITVGTNHFTRVANVSEILSDEARTRACAAPTRSETMQGLSSF